MNLLAVAVNYSSFALLCAAVVFLFYHFSGKAVTALRAHVAANKPPVPGTIYSDHGKAVRVVHVMSSDGSVITQGADGVVQVDSKKDWRAKKEDPKFVPVPRVAATAKTPAPSLNHVEGSGSPGVKVPEVTPTADGGEAVFRGDH